MEKEEYKLGIESVAHIVQLLQLSMFTGTDISQYFMLMRFEKSDKDDTSLVLSSKYKEIADKNIESLIQKAEELASGESDSSDSTEKESLN